MTPLEWALRAQKWLSGILRSVCRVRAIFLVVAIRERRVWVHHWSRNLAVVRPELLEVFVQQIGSHTAQVVAQ